MRVSNHLSVNRLRLLSIVCTVLLLSNESLAADSYSCCADSYQLGASIEFWRKVQKFEAARIRNNCEAAAVLIEIQNDLQTAVLQVNQDIASIDNEIENNSQILEYLSTRDNRRAKRSSIVGFLSTGVLYIIGSCFSYSDSAGAQVASDTLFVAGGASGIGLPLAALSCKDKKPIEGMVLEENVLASFLWPSEVNNKFSSAVWGYLSSVSPGHDRTRRKVLVDKWRSTRLFKSESSSLLRKRIFRDEDLFNARVLATRVMMLQDLKAEISNLTRLILELQIIANKLPRTLDFDPRISPEAK